MMKVEEVAVRVGVSVQTLNRWYKYKKNHPDTELSKRIPNYTKRKTSSGYVRLWKDDDVWKLVEFKTQLKPGRTGKMGKYGGRGTKNAGKDLNGINN